MSGITKSGRQAVLAQGGLSEDAVPAGVKYTLEALVRFPSGGKAQLSVTCDGKRFGCWFLRCPRTSVGVTACEGVNRFYDFKLNAAKINRWKKTSKAVNGMDWKTLLLSFSIVFLAELGERRS